VAAGAAGAASAGAARRVPAVPGDGLSDRALNRALLERQGLLARQRTTPLAMVEHLVGMQAQVPENPYVALWSRLAAFAPEDLSARIERRDAVRAQLMRSTIHLVSARDCLAFHPITAEVLAKVFRPPWLAGLRGADVGEVVAAGLESLTDEPRTRADLAAVLAPRWPDADPLALAYAVTYNAPLVQVPPRGLWGATAQARWAPAEAYVGAPVAAEPDVAADCRQEVARGRVRGCPRGHRPGGLDRSVELGHPDRRQHRMQADRGLPATPAAAAAACVGVAYGQVPDLAGETRAALQQPPVGDDPGADADRAGEAERVPHTLRGAVLRLGVRRTVGVVADLHPTAGERVLEIGRIETAAGAPQVRIAGLERWPG